MNKEEFQAKLKHTVENKILDELKSTKKNHLTYTGALSITNTVKNIFISALGIVPSQIEIACDLSNAILAPTKEERRKLIKHAKSLTSGIAGVLTIIYAISLALGWGASAYAAIAAWFTGMSILGPIGIAVTGVTLVVFAGYFATSGSPEQQTEKYHKALENTLKKAVDTIWEEYKEKLSTYNVNGN